MQSAIRRSSSTRREMAPPCRSHSSSADGVSIRLQAQAPASTRCTSISIPTGARRVARPVRLRHVTTGYRQHLRSRFTNSDYDDHSGITGRRDDMTVFGRRTDRRSASSCNARSHHSACSADRNPRHAWRVGVQPFNVADGRSISRPVRARRGQVTSTSSRTAAAPVFGVASTTRRAAGHRQYLRQPVYKLRVLRDRARRAQRNLYAHRLRAEHEDRQL